MQKEKEEYLRKKYGIKKERKSTKELFEDFYRKPFSEMFKEDLGNTEEMDFGEDVGNEKI